MNNLRVPLVALFGISQNYILQTETVINLLIGLATLVWICFKILLEAKKLKNND